MTGARSLLKNRTHSVSLKPEHVQAFVSILMLNFLTNQEHRHAD